MIDDKRLKELLLAKGLVSEQALTEFEQEKQTNGASLVEQLVAHGVVAEKDLALLVSEELSIPMLTLNIFHPDTHTLRLIPPDTARKHEVIPLAKMGKVLTVAMHNPLNMVALDYLKKATTCHIRPILVTRAEIREALDEYYADIVTLDEVLGEIDAETLEVVTDAAVTATQEDERDTAPVVRMVNVILEQAIQQRASDIHFEPFEHEFRIRYRIDGALKEAFLPPKTMQGAILARVKVMSELDITERRLPQDGRFKATLQGREVDFRVSILPTAFGEKAVLRALDKGAVKLVLGSLGFPPLAIEMLKRAVQRPYGMILTTGPTGSGKSTTLYSLLSMLNTPERNILTIEDPVEYQIEGITQTQVHPEIGLTFASGLRALLRQSPDIILVGEIRDAETADIAVKSALTGHLVLSTLHTNNACGAVTRLMDMGVEPFLIASSLIVVAAQRLCRTICMRCKEPCEIPQEVMERLKVDPEMLRQATPRRGQGCKACHQTGYYGRNGLLEIFEVDEAVRAMILDRASSDDIERVVKRKGMRTLFENATEKFLAGETTLEEVLRVTRED